MPHPPSPGSSRSPPKRPRSAGSATTTRHYRQRSIEGVMRIAALRLVTVKAPSLGLVAVTSVCVDRRDDTAFRNLLRDAEDPVLSLLGVLAGDEGQQFGRFARRSGQRLSLEHGEGGKAVPHELVDELFARTRVVPVARRLAGRGVVVIAHEPL